MYPYTDVILMHWIISGTTEDPDILHKVAHEQFSWIEAITCACAFVLLIAVVSVAMTRTRNQNCNMANVQLEANTTANVRSQDHPHIIDVQGSASQNQPVTDGRIQQPSRAAGIQSAMIHADVAIINVQLSQEDDSYECRYKTLDLRNIDDSSYTRIINESSIP